MRRTHRRIAPIVLVLALAAGCHDPAPKDGGGSAPKGAASEEKDADAGAAPTDVRLADGAGEAFLGDLPAMKARGVLRVLIAGDEEDFLPRAGMPGSYDRTLAREFAKRHGLKARFILVPSHDRLIPMLREGRGDVIAAQLTETKRRLEKVAFTQPTETVDEMVVGKKGAKEAPKGVDDLGRFEIHVRASSSYADTLRGLGLSFVPVDERFDAEKIAYDVSRGKRALTVLDSHLLEAIQAYNDGIEGLFPLATGRHIGWAVRKDSKALLAALDAFLVEKALTGHTEKRFTGDLDGIRERGVLRVLTRNNPVTYFLHRGRLRGFDYELAKRVAQDLGVRLEMVVAPSRDALIPWLLEGRGDVIAASLTVTPERAKKVAFSRPYLHMEEVLVGRAGGPALKIEELDGVTVTVRPSSSYRRTLEALKKKVPGLIIADAPESMETEELIAEVDAGKIPYTVADSHILMSELAVREHVEAALTLTGDGTHPWDDLNAGSKDIAFAVRPDALKLRSYLGAFVKKTYRGVEYNMLRKRYFENRRRIAEAKVERVGASGRLSPYDDLIKAVSARLGLDWRLMAALAYQESRFDPKAKSWVGAKGLFQVMPSTAKALGYPHPERPAQGVAAGVTYLHQLIERLDPALPFRQRVRFAMAGYNAGLGHVFDARRLAAEEGLDPDRWFGNVEKAMLMLEKPRYYRRMRHGYCRGTEPVKYVSQIQNRYDNYVNVVKK